MMKEDFGPERVQQLKTLDQSCIWHPFTQMKEYAQEDPLIIAHAEGCWLYDLAGNHYLDGVSSLWVTVHGHRKKEIDLAVRHQLEKVAHSTLLGLSNVPAILLAQKLLSIAPSNLKKVFYSDSGSTATEIALKIAFQYFQNRRIGSSKPAKSKFVTLQNAYHGDTLGAVSVGGIDLFYSIYKPLLFDSFQIPRFDLEYAENLFKEKADQIAAVIVEPMIQGAAGMLLQPRGFLRGLRELTRRHNILLIADEVATGFGRTGKMFACEHEQIEPDILCVAKGLSGGYLPLAATLATQEIYDGFYTDYQELKTFFHGHTYTGNPLACAAAIANLEIFENEKTIERLQEKIEFFKGCLEPLRAHPHIREVRQLGMMVGIELIRNKEERIEYRLEERIGHQVALAARKLGVVIRPLGAVIVLMPPLSISKEEIEILTQKTGRAIETVTLPHS